MYMAFTEKLHPKIEVGSNMPSLFCSEEKLLSFSAHKGLASQF